MLPAPKPCCAFWKAKQINCGRHRERDGDVSRNIKGTKKRTHLSAGIAKIAAFNPLLLITDADYQKSFVFIMKLLINDN